MSRFSWCKNKAPNDERVNVTTSTDVNTLQIRLTAIMPSSCWQQRLCALPCCLAAGTQ